MIYHYAGSGCSGTDSAWLHGVWGASPSNVFAVGSVGWTPYYDGTQWVDMGVEGVYSLEGVWGTSPSDVLAVGSKRGWGGYILHYDGSEWLDITNGTYPVLNNIWGTPSGEVFAVGQYGVILRGRR